MRLRTLSAAFVLTQAAIVLAAVAAHAQGRPPAPPGRSRQAATQAQQTAATIPGTGFRTFGSWLDDASIMEPGDLSVGFSAAYGRWESGRQVAAPMLDVAYGVTTRLQAGGSMQYAHATYAGGDESAGFGDLLASAKWQLVDP